MIDLKTYQRLQARLDKLRTERDKVKGALEALMARLKDDLGYNSLKEAQEQLEELEAEALEVEARYEEQLKVFQEEWEDKL